MKIQSTVLFTLSLLIGMAIATLVSAGIGFKVGSFALEGVMQPEANPTQKLANPKNSADDPQSFKPLSEKKIIDQINQEIKNKGTVIKPVAKDKPPEPKAVDSGVKIGEEQTISDRKFPLSAQDQGVTLTVAKATQADNLLVVSVNLKNESAKPVQFLYSFLEIKDEEDRTLSGITEGLPEKIPAHSQPDQTLNLTVEGIPVAALPSEPEPQ